MPGKNSVGGGDHCTSIVEMATFTASKALGGRSGAGKKGTMCWLKQS